MKKIIFLLWLATATIVHAGVCCKSLNKLLHPLKNKGVSLTHIGPKDLMFYPKHRNIALLLAKAQYENKIGTIEMLRYRRLFISSKEGDYKLLSFLKSGVLTMDNAKRIAHSPWRLKFSTVRGVILFENSHAKGRLGDHLTARRLTAMGFKKLSSKYNTLHGIDGIYVKHDASGKISEIKIVENKMDSSTLQPGPPRQMSQLWIENNLGKMMVSSDKETRKIAETTLYAIKNNPSIVSTELWHHDLMRGVTVVKRVDQNGFSKEIIKRYDDRMIFNTLEKQCEKGSLVCMPYGFQ